MATKSFRLIFATFLLSFLIVPSVFAVGIPLTIIGTTTPGALVTIRIPQLTLSKPIIADEEGHFIVTFNNVERGVYEMTISAMKDGSANEIYQLIGIPESESVNQVTLSEITIPLEPVRQIKKEKADINDNGRVDIIDLSILLFYWGSPIPFGPYRKQADLNGDGAVNLKDVSLMLSRWTN